MIRELSLKFRPHTDAEAVEAVRLAVLNAAAGRQQVVSIIHGYGSGGIGGSNKEAVHALLDQLSTRGDIQRYIPGESLRKSDLDNLSRRFNGHQSSFRRLYRNCGNPGTTLILL